MNSVARALSCAALGTLSLLASSARADDKPEAAVDAAAMPSPSEEPKTAASTPAGEIELYNAAVNRAFAGGEVKQPEAPARTHHFGVYIGFRFLNLTHPGYDPYSESDALVQNALGFSFTPWKSERLQLHFLGEWNIGASTAYARGAQTDLLVNRIALGVEGRWMPKSRFYLYAKIVPSVVNLSGKIEDWDLGVDLESSSWAMVLDTSAGAALRLGTAGKAPGRTASFWLMMDWGYAFASQASMTFRPPEIEDEPRKFGSINLPGLRPGGFVTRASFGVTF